MSSDKKTSDDTVETTTTTITDANEHLNIKVDGNEVFFKIKKSTPLKKLMDAYHKKQGLSDGSIRFTFDGSRINETDTAKKLGIEDNDVLDAMVEQTGGVIFNDIVTTN